MAGEFLFLYKYVDRVDHLDFDLKTHIDLEDSLFACYVSIMLGSWVPQCPTVGAL